MNRFDFLNCNPRYRVIGEGFCFFRPIEASRVGWPAVYERYMKRLSEDGKAIGAERIENIREIPNPHRLQVEVRCVYLRKS